MRVATQTGRRCNFVRNRRVNCSDFCLRIVVGLSFLAVSEIHRRDDVAVDRAYCAEFLALIGTDLNSDW